MTLGRTGLSVGMAGLGCGGHSRLGQGSGATRADSIRLVKAALDLGVTLIDTAAVYGTEEIVAAGIKGRRDQVVLSTKLPIVKPGTSARGSDFLDAAAFTAALEGSLSRLDTDVIDILHLHGVMPEQYDHCAAALVPVLFKLRDQGKIRFLGLTERFISDPRHRMLQRALKDDCWDVIMTGFNMINPSARQRVFATTRAKGVGTLVMFAVRRALSQPAALKALIADLLDRGLIDADALDADDPLGFLLAPGGAASVVEAAYRFCRHEPGADVVLTGTGKVAHLEQNLAAINAGALPAAMLARLQQVFGAIDSVSGE